MFKQIIFDVAIIAFIIYAVVFCGFFTYTIVIGFVGGFALWLMENKGYLINFKALQETLSDLEEALSKQDEVKYQLRTILKDANYPDLSSKELALFAFQSAHLNFLYNKAAHHYKLCHTYRHRFARLVSRVYSKEFRELPKQFKKLEYQYFLSRKESVNYIDYKFFSLFSDQS